MSGFFFWKLRKTCNWRKNKSQFISYIVNARVGLWNSTAEPKFTVLGLTKPRPIPWILSPGWNFSSHTRMRLFIFHWYNMREVGNNLLYNLSPSFRFHQFLLSYYNRNSWIRLKAKIPKFYLCTCSLLQIDRNEKTIYFFLGGGMRKSDIFFIYLIVHVTSCIVLQHYHPGSECEWTK